MYDLSLCHSGYLFLVYGTTVRRKDGAGGFIKTRITQKHQRKDKRDGKMRRGMI